MEQISTNTGTTLKGNKIVLFLLFVAYTQQLAFLSVILKMLKRRRRRIVRGSRWISRGGRQGASDKRANSDFLCWALKILIGWLKSGCVGYSFMTAPIEDLA